MGLLFGVGQTRPAFAYDYYYGIEWDTAVSNPNCTRVGKMELHAELPVHQLMRRCVLDDDGVVVYYLNANDSTKTDTGATAKLDGTDGQVMVEIPDMYVRFETNGTKNRCLMSTHALPGFVKWGKKYVSAYEATVHSPTNKLSSVMSMSPDYRGGNNTASYDGTYRTMLGRPASGNLSLTSFRTYARNRKSGSTEWNCNTYDTQKALYWLFAVEYATLNSQKEFNAQLDENGYHQGGLGDGVTTVNSSQWSSLFGYYPFVPCGITNALGNKSGVVDYDVPNDGGVWCTVHVPSYRGVENPFGHIWKWTDGCLCDIQSNEAGGESIFYVWNKTADYSSTLNPSAMSRRGSLPRSNGYVKTVGLGEYGEIMPSAVGGGSTTYFCDYLYTNIPSSGTATRGVLFGGYAHYGAYAGFVCALTAYAPSVTSASIGSRLCFIPSVE